MIAWKTYFQYQIDYQHWANERLFESLDKLSDDLRKQDEGLFYKSIHGTVNHLLVQNLIWSGRLNGESPELRLDSQLHDDWRELKLALKQSARQLQHWLQAQPPEFFEQELRYLQGGTLEHRQWVHDVLTHFCHQCAGIRGQIGAIATRLGAPAPEFDYLFYRREMQDSLANARQSANG